MPGRHLRTLGRARRRQQDTCAATDGAQKVGHDGQHASVPYWAWRLFEDSLPTNMVWCTDSCIKTAFLLERLFSGVFSPCWLGEGTLLKVVLMSMGYATLRQSQMGLYSTGNPEMARRSFWLGIDVSLGSAANLSSPLSKHSLKGPRQPKPLKV